MRFAQDSREYPMSMNLICIFSPGYLPHVWCITVQGIGDVYNKTNFNLIAKYQPFPKYLYPSHDFSGDSEDHIYIDVPGQETPLLLIRLQPMRQYTGRSSLPSLEPNPLSSSEELPPFLYIRIISFLLTYESPPFLVSTPWSDSRAILQFLNNHVKPLEE